jgi:AcrR family transcriptional regulator
MVGIDDFLLISCISQLTDFTGARLMAGKLTSGEKRQKLARAAMNVIWRDGYHAATIQAVADEAGLPAGGVFYRFPKKHDLAQAALETMENEFTPLLASIAPNGTVRQRLSIFFDYLDAMTPRRVSHGCPLARLMLDLPADGAFDPARQTGQAVFDGLINWVAGQLARAGMADERARTEGRRMILRWQGAIILAHSMADRAILDDEIRDLRDTANRLIDGA